MMHKLLIIDDAADVHRLIRARLEEDAAYEIRSAFDAESGANLARAFRPDLILLDVDLPGLDGYALCEQLKHDPQTARIPVVFLTAAHTTAHKVRGLELGAIDFITKPFDPAELRARVRASLRTKALIDELSDSRVRTFVRDAMSGGGGGGGGGGQQNAAPAHRP
jgi:two-component system phosphate regulon response regulator PhoB